MYSYSFVLFVTLCCAVYAENGFLPSYIVPCELNAADFNQCLRTQFANAIPHFTKGIPELGVPSLDPVDLDDILIDGNGLKLQFTKATMHGLQTAELTKLSVNIGNSVDDFELGFKANLNLTSKYKIDGRILVLPIQGQGDAVVDATNVNVVITSKLTHVKAADGEHFKLSSPSYKYTIENTVFDLQNLFNGNKQLAEVTLQFANQNWRQLMDDLAPPAIKQIVKTCVKYINKFFAKVTIKQMVKGYVEQA